MGPKSIKRKKKVKKKMSAAEFRKEVERTASKRTKQEQAEIDKKRVARKKKVKRSYSK